MTSPWPAADIIGHALVTPLGEGLDAIVPRLLAGERAVRDNPHFPADTYGCRVASPITNEPAKSKHDRVLRRMGRFGYAVAAAALARSAIESGPRLGLFSGVGGLRAHWNDMLAALADQDDSFDDSWRRGLRRLHPFWMLQHLSNNAHALLSADVDARGEGATYGGANAGAQALAAATWALASNAVDAALVVTYDSLIEPETLIEMVARGATTNAAPGDVRQPYSADAQGFVPGEAAAAVVLCRPGEGDAPLATVRAQTAADGSAGTPAIETLAALARDAGPFEVADGCALAEPAFDAAERDALDNRALTAVQAATGQLGAAAPLVQALCLAGCLRRGKLPPIADREHATQTSARSALCASVGAPGLAGIVVVELPHNGDTR